VSSLRRFFRYRAEIKTANGGENPAHVIAVNTPKIRAMFYEYMGVRKASNRTEVTFNIKVTQGH